MIKKYSVRRNVHSVSFSCLLCGRCRCSGSLTVRSAVERRAGYGREGAGLMTASSAAQRLHAHLTASIGSTDDEALRAAVIMSPPFLTARQIGQPEDFFGPCADMRLADYSSWMLSGRNAVVFCFLENADGRETDAASLVNTRNGSHRTKDRIVLFSDDTRLPNPRFKRLRVAKVSR